MNMMSGLEHLSYEARLRGAGLVQPEHTLWYAVTCLVLLLCEQVLLYLISESAVTEAELRNSDL